MVLLIFIESFPNIQPGIYWGLGWTPLHFAVFNGNVDGVELLLHYGARKDIKTFNGDTPMDFAQRRYRRNSEDTRMTAIIGLLK